MNPDLWPNLLDEHRYIYGWKVFALGSAHKPESMPLDSTYESPKKTNEQKKGRKQKSKQK